MEKVLNWISSHDKLTHAIVCFMFCVSMGVAASIAAALTKEASDWLYKRNYSVGYGWDWYDVAADMAGIILGIAIRLLIF